MTVQCKAASFQYHYLFDPLYIEIQIQTDPSAVHYEGAYIAALGQSTY